LRGPAEREASAPSARPLGFNAAAAVRAADYLALVTRPVTHLPANIIVIVIVIVNISSFNRLGRLSVAATFI